MLYSGSRSPLMIGGDTRRSTARRSLSSTMVRLPVRTNRKGSTACTRQAMPASIMRLREDGVIKQTVALLDARSLNVGTTVFVTLKTANHSEAWFEKFVCAVRDIPEVTEIHRMSGEVDYLMRIVVPDIDAYDVVYKRLISAVQFLDVSASFTLETIKYTTALPLSYVKLD